MERVPAIPRPKCYYPERRLPESKNQREAIFRRRAAKKTPSRALIPRRLTDARLTRDDNPEPPDFSNNMRFPFQQLAKA